jgi:sulfatase maturation enzyme AslB (radical SAM superfamily)
MNFNDLIRKFKSLSFAKRMSVPNPPGKLCVELNITYQCQNRCGFCYKDGAAVECDYMTMKAFETYVRFIKLEFRDRPIRWEFSGGEPTLHPQLPDMIHLLCRQGRLEPSQNSVTVVTNGIVLADMSFCKDLVETGLDSVRLTFFNGHAEIHDRMSRIVGSFDNAYTGLRNIMRIASSNLNVNAHIVLTNENISSFSDTVRFLAKEGVRTISVNRAIPILRGDNIISNTLPVVEYAAAVMAGDHVARNEGVIFKNLHKIPPCEVSEFPENLRALNPCGIGESLIVIEPDGTLIGCDFYPVPIGRFQEKNDIRITFQHLHSNMQEVIPIECRFCEHLK